ncbi:50S ribosomal protein L25/general stress protein Ctc [Phenylobacterium sp. 58.2.17]|uniref:50S ribosomal protein L25/general stress protein Ctc n=1 Tax=Phenylobacterium sp. 58.2.17 TaxID=2969306 RepID=UPI0022649050|nr:50S ribosomal protein L25/general stress protein Ctc [Phenylobacterium sp. 58.2.17]MCX7585667.1 50S ribosomal protein L25/general stress protein Ctc [Phenylobacterium sp. 58.2.17]
MADIILNVELRERIGTGGARAARREGLVPGVLYGGDKDPVAITVKSNEFRKALYTGKLLGHLVTLKHGNETQPVIAKVVDMHPVTDEPMHFDLFRVDAHQTIKISVPVHFKNQEASPGLKKGGTLNVVRHEVELSCPADAIPEELVFDLTGLEIGDTIRIGAFELPKGVSPSVDRDFVIATVAGSAAGASEAAEEAAGEAES